MHAGGIPIGTDSGLLTTSALPLRDLAPVLVVWLVLAFLPLGRVSELPLLVGAIWGVVLVGRQGWDTLTMPGVRLALMLFACYWLPALVSAIDAVEPGKTWTQVAAQLRYAPFAVFVAATLKSDAQWAWLLRATALLVLVWVLDAWVQSITGSSLGGAMDSDRVSGIFGADNLKLGGVLAVLSPLPLACAQQRWGMRGVFIAALLLAGAILLAGARAAWLVYALVLVGWCVKPFAGRVRHAILLLVVLIGAGAALGYAVYRLSPSFAERMDRTLHLASGTTRDVDHALAGRLPIWRTAAAMAQAHPVNGVGVRGFRHAYGQYAAVDDPWRVQGGALHPHQVVLEVVAETGIVGLLAWLLAGLLVVSAVARADPSSRARAWPMTLALAVMCFPLNTHYAFYSSWWGLFFWWMVAVAVAVTHLPRSGRGA
jgi:O-antigen ligase